MSSLCESGGLEDTVVSMMGGDCGSVCISESGCVLVFGALSRDLK